MNKNLLIIAVNVDWTGISRLPSGLHRAGFVVNALCPRKSYLAKTKFLAGVIRYPTFSYSRSKLIYLWALFAILYFKPDMIIPGDEDAILVLHNLANFCESFPMMNGVSDLIRQSLTPKEFDKIILSKSEFQEKCRSWGVRSPQNIIVENVTEALAVADKMGYPVVLKHDSGYGGSGVFICHHQVDIQNHFAKIQNVGWLQKIKAYFKNAFFITIFNQDKKISVQQFIKGDVGQSPFCARNGKILAFNPMLRLHTYPGVTGPATVSRGYENPDVKPFVETVAKNLRITGFASIEYMIEAKTGLLYVIELNPRPTPTCHITNRHVTNDLCEAFFNGLNGFPLKQNLFKPYTIAMFPGELKRDPQSKYLKEGYHDVPVNDPALFQALNPIS